MPRLTLVGRENVGKSSLYNCLVTSGAPTSKCIAGNQLALVGPDPGTTRDRREYLWSCGSLTFLLTDTPSILADVCGATDTPKRQINHQVAAALEASDVALFIVDAKEGVTSDDEFIAKHLRMLTKNQRAANGRTLNLGLHRQEEDSASTIEHSPVILVLNKAEGSRAANCIGDAYELHLGHPVAVSTKTNQNVKEAAATEAWLEGLSRRYGRGAQPVLAHKQSLGGYLHLPWSLKKSSPDDAEFEAPEQCEQDNCLDHDTVMLTIPERSPFYAHRNSRTKFRARYPEALNRGFPVVVLGHVQQGHMVEASNDECSKEPWSRETEEPEAPNILPASSVRPSANLDVETEKSEEPIRLTFIGRPNAGKSSLINSILKEDRLMTSAKPGTTTDSVCINFCFKKQQMTLIDTAGVSRGWKMRGDDMLQQASLQTMRNIRAADVCILCLDAAHIEETGHIGSHDLSLANLASDKEGRSLVVCVTKWDLVDMNRRSQMRTLVLERLQTGLGHLKSCPVVFTSAAHAENLNTLLNKACAVYKRWCGRVPTGTINAWLQQYMSRWPPPWRLGSQCQVKYITQAQTKPPTFVAWSNVYAHFPTHYKRQLVNAIREEFDMKGIPVRLVLRTTAMPKPGARLTKAEALKWKRLGPHQRYEDRRGHSQSFPKTPTPPPTRNPHHSMEREKSVGIFTRGLANH
ncbi:small GTP-binding protein, putative [Eimeria tenella]|uniref:Small GTP-binding protein, putative n=1 Tax=Eimeria tenella TaxID=5802 RepID=U6KRL5_EIMTE|nr:small GTP-binding protein, putative [Eimeria tenella]CDJ38984.1 small GTP-binding protein, putative [Eimeria tenella]|eukprot:XP_013229739.1 small GTP-binding protein, putative [Eimeria tenella]